MPLARPQDDIENLPPNSATRWGRLRDAVNLQWLGLENMCLVRWSAADGGWVMWMEPDPVQGNMTHAQADSENLPPVSNTRSGRLREAVNVQWAGIEDICLLRWSEAEGWIMWKDPDPIP